MGGFMVLTFGGGSGAWVLCISNFTSVEKYNDGITCSLQGVSMRTRVSIVQSRIVGQDLMDESDCY